MITLNAAPGQTGKRLFAFLAALLCLCLPLTAHASGEIQATASAGQTLYAVVQSSNGLPYNGTAFAAYSDANWSTYALPVGELGTSHLYAGAFPAVGAGLYSVSVYARAGATPALTDTLVATGNVDWTGTAIASVGINTGTLANVQVQSTIAATQSTSAATSSAANATALAALTTSVASLPTAASFWSYSTRTLTAQADTPGTATLLARLGTPTGASIDADILSRLAASAYTAPTPAPTVTAIRQEIDTNSTQLGALVAGQGTLTTGIAAVPAATLAAVKADTLFATLLGHNQGKFTYVPATHSLQLLMDDGTTPLGAPLTLAVDGSGNITQRK